MTTEHKSIWTWLFNPFVYVAGGRSLLMGVVAVLAAGLIGALSNTHFNGVLDMHTGMASPLWMSLSEGLIAWLLLGNVLLIFGKIVSRTSFRSIDLLGTQAMARWPTVLSALLLLPAFIQDANKRFATYVLGFLGNASSVPPLSISDTVIVAVTIVLVFLMTCWFVVLAYNSYTVSCNIKGGKAIGTFIAGLLIAEILGIILMPIIFAVIQRIIGGAHPSV